MHEEAKTMFETTTNHSRKIMIRRLISSLSKATVPEVCPPLLALPISQRPLFPHIPKTLQIKDPRVCAAVKNLSKSSKPYLGAFMTQGSSDVIHAQEDASKIGVFCQILGVEDSPDGQVRSFTHR